MTLTIALGCATALLALAALGTIIGRLSTGTLVVYGGSLVIAAVSFLVAW